MSLIAGTATARPLKKTSWMRTAHSSRCDWMLAGSGRGSSWSSTARAVAPPTWCARWRPGRCWPRCGASGM
eukprot:10245743-Lingulodinium_polyedra.AAC.1